MTSSIEAELRAAGPRAEVRTTHDKKNYAERLSRALAQRLANALRPAFPGILPDPSGVGQETRARSSKGFKKLDVNYSTVELGLGLGVSIKTINFPDGASQRYTKNYTRVDAELRAEASDYHERQPFAVLAALIFLPSSACDDGAPTNPSSFGSAVRAFRYRAGRSKPEDDAMLFERVFIGLYDTREDTFGRVSFFDVMEPPPKRGYPSDTLSFDQMISCIVETYDARNAPTFLWAGGEQEVVIADGSEGDQEVD